jgi:hypothetical protein
MQKADGDSSTVAWKWGVLLSSAEFPSPLDSPTYLQCTNGIAVLRRHCRAPRARTLTHATASPYVSTQQRHRRRQPSIDPDADAVLLQLYSRDVHKVAAPTGASGSIWWPITYSSHTSPEEVVTVTWRNYRCLILQY